MDARNVNDAELKRLARVKRSDVAPTPQLGPELISFFKQNVQKRQAKFAPIAACWDKLVPEALREHAALESFSHGSLTVIVDSASHLYELRQLLLAGLEKQITIACKSAGLRKIVLKPGRWYDGSGESSADQRLRF
jgi:hypothetical protein